MAPCPTIHLAFYLWYATPEHDGSWRHWDHAELPHWDLRVRVQYPRHGTSFKPPDEPHSPFYPARGLYSSHDKAVLLDQMREISAAGVDSVMLSWWGQAAADVTRDSQGVSTDELVPAVLDAAAAAGVGVTWHIEPYGGRNAHSVLADLRYLAHEYGHHPAIWRQPRSGTALPGDPGATPIPVVFLYDVSAQHSGGTAAEQRGAAAEWRAVARAVRHTPADALLLSLYLEPRDAGFISDAGLDGAYTYFAAAGFTQGSEPTAWRKAREDMSARSLMFVPSVGPGYNDTLIRPWNHLQTKPREGGSYYDRAWRLALEAEPGMVTITSFNEWGYGSASFPSHRSTAPVGRAASELMSLAACLRPQRRHADRSGTAAHGVHRRGVLGLLAARTYLLHAEDARMGRSGSRRLRARRPGWRPDGGRSSLARQAKGSARPCPWR